LNFKFLPVKLVYGGQALGFHAGHTVLVPRVLPGERAEVAEIRRQKGVIQARPLQVLEPSPNRREPPCPYFGSCGGCQYQHLAYPAQAAAKAEILRETLRRLGQVKWDQPIPTHSGPEWNYRNQAQLKVGRSPDGTAALGFFEAESNQLVSIDACPILSPRLNATLAVLRSAAWTGALANCSELELVADHDDEKVMLTLTGSWGAAEAEAVARRCLEELAGVSTVAITGNSGLRILGDPHLSYRVGEFAYRLSPTAFFQSARFLLPEFVTAVTGGESGAVALDLYAGVGLFTLPLATRFDQVIGVESHPRAAEDLTANARTAALQNIRAVRATAFDFLRRYAQMDPDLVVVDPPRTGVGTETLKFIVDLRPKHLRYVSCSPPTLARDLQFLLKHGYRLDSLEMFDFFPQTYHIESLAQLKQNG
jgi:23S rRNA (uracil1939-C5)-methyltransferase